MITRKLKLITCVVDSEENIYKVIYEAEVELDFFEVIFNLFSMTSYAKRLVVSHLRNTARTIDLSVSGAKYLEDLSNESGFFRYNIDRIEQKR